MSGGMRGSRRVSVLREFIQESLRVVKLPVSEGALVLLQMIAAHESGGLMYVRQFGGPALGLWQMEPVGYREVQRYVQLRDEKFHRLIHKHIKRDFEWLAFDQVWACQCARIFLMAEPQGLPEKDDIEGMGAYAKRYWNTEQGAACVEDYVEAYEVLCG